jgi:transposase-like protein
MEKATIDRRARAVLLYLEGVEEAAKICDALGISRRTLTRWVRAYRDGAGGGGGGGGIRALHPKKPGPEHSTRAISRRLEKRIIALKQRHPSWGARRIKNQYDFLPLGDRPQDHQALWDARQDQAEASAIEALSAISRRLYVAG